MPPYIIAIVFMAYLFITQLFDKVRQLFLPAPIPAQNAKYSLPYNLLQALFFLTSYLKRRRKKGLLARLFSLALPLLVL